MMPAAQQSQDFHALVDVENGTIDRRFYADEQIYQLELERIFARGWSFMCHDSQIPNPGDFFMTFIGEDRVIAVRDNDGNPQVLVNTCRHRGNAVCRAEEGHSSSFMCTYHGWTYDLKGSLVGVPGFKEVYHEELDRENWGLIKAPNVEAYKGFVFASLDAEAPPLLEYLGEVGQIGISMMAERGEDVAILGGVQKYSVNCNWKFAVDNVFDYYHVELTHSSAILSRETRRPSLMGTTQRVMLGRYGHAIGGPAYDPVGGAQAWWRDREASQIALGPGNGLERPPSHISEHLDCDDNQPRSSSAFPGVPPKLRCGSLRSSTEACRRSVIGRFETTPFTSTDRPVRSRWRMVRTGTRARPACAAPRRLVHRCTMA